MNQQENDKRTVIEDLPVEAAAQQQVEGGNRGNASNNTVYFTNDYSLTI